MRAILKRIVAFFKRKTKQEEEIEGYKKAYGK